MRCIPVAIDPEQADRSCGFLTKTEREYLLGTWEPSGEGEKPTKGQLKRKRSDIKVRTRHALADFALLHQYSDQELKEEVIEENAEPKIFADETVKHISEGLLPFVTDAALGEDTHQLFADALENPEIARLLADILSASIEAQESDSKEPLLDAMDSMKRLVEDW